MSGRMHISDTQRLRSLIKEAIEGMLAYTYPHKPPRKITLTICNHQADIQLYVWPDV